MLKTIKRITKQMTCDHDYNWLCEMRIDTKNKNFEYVKDKPTIHEVYCRCEKCGKETMFRYLKARDEK